MADFWTKDAITGRITITKSGRTVIDSGVGKMLALIPTIVDIKKTITFPDFKKDIRNLWWFDTSGGGTTVSYQGTSQNFITAIPQELKTTIVLGLVPKGVNHFQGRIKIARTKAPSTWMGQVPPVRPKENQWLLFNGGSLMMERRRNMTRLLHIFISGTNLVAQVQQSVGPAPGGYGAHGDQYGITNSFVEKATGSLESFVKVAGTPIYTDLSHFKQIFPKDTKPVGGSSPYFYPEYFSVVSNMKLGGTNAPSTLDPTNYASTYTIELQGQYGHRQ